MPKISIIMPCLNSAKYIAEAVNSILEQTFTDFELIVVDSGSTDGTLSILNGYGSRDKRVRLLNCSKKSMGAQYNLGLEYARGEYVGFVESDDYIDSKTYETFVNAFVEHTTDYVKANFDMFVDLPDNRLGFTHGPIAENQREFYNKVIGSEEISELVRRDIFIWNGLYKRDFINRQDIRFSETPGAAFQDAGFISQVLFSAERAVYLDISLYRYRKGNAIASSSSLTTHKFVMDEFAYVVHKLKQNYKKEYLFLPAFLRRYFGSFHNCLHQYLYYNGYTDELKRLVLPFAKLFRECYDSLELPQLSRSDIWPPQDIVLFFADFEAYCKASLSRYESDILVNSQAVKYLSKQKELVICGIGENAASVYCYLSRQSLKNIAAFCSDFETDVYYEKEVLTMSASTRRYPNATYILTQSVGNQNKYKQHLRLLGITLEQIIYYGAGLFHHNWHELPLNPKEG